MRLGMGSFCSPLPFTFSLALSVHSPRRQLCPDKVNRFFGPLVSSGFGQRESQQEVREGRVWDIISWIPPCSVARGWLCPSLWRGWAVTASLKSFLSLTPGFCNCSFLWFLGHRAGNWPLLTLLDYGFPLPLPLCCPCLENSPLINSPELPEFKSALEFR